MGYLNGNNIPALLSFRSLCTKFVGTCCGVCANIALGPEAPMVHLGACVAHGVTHAACGESFCPQQAYIHQNPWFCKCLWEQKREWGHAL